LIAGGRAVNQAILGGQSIAFSRVDIDRIWGLKAEDRLIPPRIFRFR